MKKKLKFVEWTTLRHRSAVDQLPDEEVHGTLLVSEEPVLTYEEGHTQYGNDFVRLYAAFHDGNRCWVKQSRWEASYGYSATGTCETVLSFESGVWIFLKQKTFEFLQEEEE